MRPPALTETEASTCSNTASPWSLILQVKPTRMKESPKQHNGAAPSAAGGLLLQLLAESFADLRFSAICGCWSGMVLQSAASPLPAPTPAHSNGSRGAAAAARAAPPGGGRDTVGRAGGIHQQQQLGGGSSIQASIQHQQQWEHQSKPSQLPVTTDCIKRSSNSALSHLCLIRQFNCMVNNKT